MTDPRLTPDPTKVMMQDTGQITQPVADLCRGPNGPRDRQLIYGDAVSVLAQTDGWSYVQSNKDRYCGYVVTSALGPVVPPTHRVTAPATHAYAEPDIKSRDLASLTFGSAVTVGAADAGFAQTPLGYIPQKHLAPIDTLSTDPAEIALLFVGTPYLWGGNSRWGIDCSGLVQAALRACGIACPADSDQQQRMLGEAIPENTALARNDLLFWKGHVSLVLEPDLMIHANAHNMAVTLEPIGDALQRIAKTDGPVTARKRLNLSKWSEIRTR